MVNHGRLPILFFENTCNEVTLMISLCPKHFKNNYANPPPTAAPLITSMAGYRDPYN